MSTETSVTSVEQTVSVALAPREAFDLFVHRMESWWPEDHHMLDMTDDELDRMVVEPEAGGRIYDVAKSGNECCWAHVLAYEPPVRFAFSWDITPTWQIEQDRARCSEVNVSFEPDGDGTLVRLVHRHLDRHGEGWEGMRDAVGSPGGWGRGLSAFVAAAAG